MVCATRLASSRASSGEPLPRSQRHPDDVHQPNHLHCVLRQVSLCYVLNAIQMIFISPIVFMLLGAGASKRDAPKDAPAASTAAVVLGVSSGLCQNPVIVSVVSGLGVNLIFGSGRHAHAEWDSGGCVSGWVRE